MFYTIFQQILALMSHNVPALYDVPGTVARPGRACALGLCLDILFLFPLSARRQAGTQAKK
jgi:hypothetical protein